MAYGLPVIATPNCAQVVNDGQNGMIVPARDSVKLAAAIEAFVADRSLVQERGQAAIESVNQYSIDALGERLLSLQNQLQNDS